MHRGKRRRRGRWLTQSGGVVCPVLFSTVWWWCVSGEEEKVSVSASTQVGMGRPSSCNRTCLPFDPQHRVNSTNVQIEKTLCFKISVSNLYQLVSYPVSGEALINMFPYYCLTSCHIKTNIPASFQRWLGWQLCPSSASWSPLPPSPSSPLLSSQGLSSTGVVTR